MNEQTARPSHFPNRWTIAGAHDETQNAGRECEVLGYMKDADGRDLCHVRFLDGVDMFGDESYCSPFELFPVTD